MSRLFLPILFLTFVLNACESGSSPQPLVEAAPAASWPSESWQTSTPEQEDLDGPAIRRLDEEFRAGKHGYVDLMLIVRNGRLAFEAYYENDYQTINADLVTAESKPWNYYDANWHPFRDGSDLQPCSRVQRALCRHLLALPLTAVIYLESIPHSAYSYRIGKL